MSVGFLNTAISGLSAYQQALETISNNISNANTPGYSVQNVQLGTQKEQYTGSGYMGSGVMVNTVARNYDQFLNAQVRSTTSAYNSSNTYYTMASQIDNMIADQNAGLSSSMTNFFNAINGVANDPTSIPSRQVMLDNGKSLANQFNSIQATFSNLRQQVDSNLSNSVKTLNGYAQGLAQLNTQIALASHNGTSQTPNALLDQRDQILNQISQMVDASVVEQTDGSVNVYVAQGQPLVIGAGVSQLSVQNSPIDSTHLQLLLNGHDVTNQFTGGQVAGNIQFRDQVLDPAQAKLGLIATSLATQFNTVHQAGVDLNGNTGAAFFTLGTPTVQVSGQYSDQNLMVSAGFVAPTTVPGLAASYRLDVTSNSPNTYNLTNLDTGTTVSGLDDTALTSTAAADGFSISFSGGSLSPGDTFKISPNSDTAATIQVNAAITTPNQIAAATSGGNLPGDNTNALALAALQKQTLLDNGTVSFSQAYGQLVTNVGNSTNTAKINSAAQNTVMQNAISTQQSFSGVNLNEEAAKLIQFQNSYQASAKSISIAQTLFSQILNAVS